MRIQSRFSVCIDAVLLRNRPARAFSKEIVAKMERASLLRASLAAAALVFASALQFDVDAGRTKVRC